MPKLILHAGMPKTGTSTIQSNLSRADWENILGIQKIHYLKGASIKENHSDYLHALYGKPRWNSAEQHQHSIKLFSDAIDRVTLNVEPYSSILISAESVSDIARNSGNLRLLKNFVSRYFSRIRIIVYVREPLSYICSRMQQDLKSAYPMGASVIRNAIGTADCTVILTNLRHIFGESNVTIRSYDPGVLEGRDIVTDFCLGALALPDTLQLRQQLDSCLDENLTPPPELIQLLVHLYERKRISPETLRTDQSFFRILNTFHCKGDTRFAIEFCSPAARQRISAVADRLRARTRDYLGYDCFPSYQPVNINPHRDIVPGRNSVQAFQSIAAILEGHLIEYGENNSGCGAQYEDKAGGYGETRDEAKSRAYQLLETLYERCNAQQG